MALRVTQRLNALRDNLGSAPTLAESRRKRLGLYLVRLSLLIVRQWIRDKPLQQAAALTYQTALSLVPLIAVAFTLLHVTADKAVEEKLLAFISTQLLPDMQDVTTHLRAFAANISTGAFGIAGLFFTFITSWWLYDSVERVFNDIWRTPRRRSLVSRLLTFYALVTLLPLLAGSSLYFSGKLIGSGLGAQLIVPLLIQFSALFLTNKLLPNTHVRWWAALAGCLVTGILLEALKLGFVAFVKRTMLENYSGVYGAVGIIPMLLVWMNLSWLLVLLGAEIANAAQNLRQLEAEERRRTGDEPVNGLSAAQILALVAADHERGGKGVTRKMLVEHFGLTANTVDAICARLIARGLLAEVTGDKEGFIPGRNAATIPLEEVLRAFRAHDLETAHGMTSPALLKLAADLDEMRRKRIEGLTIAALQPALDAPPIWRRQASPKPAPATTAAHNDASNKENG